jgi:drug/metabolite transporter (DMT)-like permease
MSDKQSGILCGLLAVLCWSGFIVVSRLGGKTSLQPHDMLWLRFSVGSLLLLPFAWRRILWTRRGAVLALIGGFGYALPVYAGFRLAPAQHAAVLVAGAIPFGAALFSAWLLGQSVGRSRGVGLAMILVAGVLLLMEAGIGATLLGDAWFVLAMLCWSLYSVLARRWQVAPLDAAVTVAVLCALVCLPVCLLILPSNIGHVPFQDVFLQGFYQGVIATVVAMLLYMRAVSTIGPAAMGAMMALVPVLASLLAVPVLGETFTMHTVIALVLSTMGAFLAAGMWEARRASASA